MNKRTIVFRACGLLLFVGAPDAATPCFGQEALYHITLDTAALQNLHPSIPYYLDFQLIDGSGTLAGANTVTLSHFAFGGGTAEASPYFTTGNVAGSLASQITLQDDSAILNELEQAFQPGTQLAFDARITTNGENAPTPDSFSFAIVDGFNQQAIPTTGPGDALLTIDLHGMPPTIQTYGADPDRTGIPLPAPQAVGVPEPGLLPWLLASVGSLVLWRRHRA